MCVHVLLGFFWDYNKPVLLNTFVSQGSAKETGMEERNMCQRRECQKQPADYITSLVLWYPRVWLLLHGHGDSNFLDKPTSIFLLDSNLTARFLESGTMAIPTKSQNVLGQGHTLAGFAIGALRLATMATLHLRALHKINICSCIAILISCQPRVKKNIYYNLVWVVTLN